MAEGGVGGGQPGRGFSVSLPFVLHSLAQQGAVWAWEAGVCMQSGQGLVGRTGSGVLLLTQ